MSLSLRDWGDISTAIMDALDELAALRQPAAEPDTAGREGHVLHAIADWFKEDVPEPVRRMLSARDLQRLADRVSASTSPAPRSPSLTDTAGREAGAAEMRERAARIAAGDVYQERYRTWLFWPADRLGEPANVDKENRLATHADAVAAAIRSLPLDPEGSERTMGGDHD